jgi:hypothetical protein
MRRRLPLKVACGLFVVFTCYRKTVEAAIPVVARIVSFVVKIE